MKSNKEVSENINNMTDHIRQKFYAGLDNGETAYLYLRKGEARLFPCINMSGNMPKTDDAEVSLDSYRTLTTIYSLDEGYIYNYSDDYYVLADLFRVLDIDTTNINEMFTNAPAQRLTQVLLDGKHTLAIKKQTGKNGQNKYLASVITLGSKMNDTTRTTDATAQASDIGDAIIGATNRLNLSYYTSIVDNIRANEQKLKRLMSDNEFTK